MKDTIYFVLTQRMICPSTITINQTSKFWDNTAPLRQKEKKVKYMGLHIYLKNSQIALLLDILECNLLH